MSLSCFLLQSVWLWSGEREVLTSLNTHISFFEWSSIFHRIEHAKSTRWICAEHRPASKYSHPIRRIVDCRAGMRNAGCGTENRECGMRNTESGSAVWPLSVLYASARTFWRAEMQCPQRQENEATGAWFPTGSR